MADEKIIENPEQGTAGLTSALQLTNTTSAISYASDACSDSTELLIIFPVTKEEHIQFPQEPKPYLSRRQQFRKALEESSKRNKDIFEELAKF